MRRRQSGTTSNILRHKQRLHLHRFSHLPLLKDTMTFTRLRKGSHGRTGMRGVSVRPSRNRGCRPPRKRDSAHHTQKLSSLPPCKTSLEADCECATFQAFLEAEQHEDELDCGDAARTQEASACKCALEEPSVAQDAADFDIDAALELLLKHLDPYLAE